jgi:hypothetical protein
MDIRYRRPDGTFVAQIEGLPYHIDAADKLFEPAAEQAKRLGGALQQEPMPPEISFSLADFEEAVQAVVDLAAREKQFRDGVTLSSYVASTDPKWAEEARVFVAWRDKVWGYCYQELEKVRAGGRAQPTIEGFLAELPSIAWP